MGPGDERRTGSDRRRRRPALRYPERRTGFDQRECQVQGLRGAIDRAMLQYRERRSAFLLVLATIVVFNYLDLMLTFRAIGRGAVEANPIMAFLFASDPVLAAAVKLAIGGGVALTLLALGRFKRVLEASLVILVSFTALMGYHAVLLTVV